MDRLPRTELIMGMEFNECSIASAELSARVDSLINRPGGTEAMELYVHGDVGVQKITADTVTVSEPLITPQGRHIDLMLTRDWSDAAGIPRLMAVTRGDIAFPLAGFARREGMCDYVQIGQEVTNESLIVTPVDEGSRKDIIEAMRDMLSLDPFLIKHKDLVEQCVRYSKKNLFQEIENRRYAVGELFRKQRLNKSGLQLLAVLALDDPELVNKIGEQKGNVSLDYNYRIGRLSKDPRKEGVYKSTKRLLDNFFQNPELALLKQGGLPGAYYAEAQRLLVKHYLKTLGVDISTAFNRDVNRDAERKAQSGSRNFMQLMDIDQQIDKVLGPYNAKSENIISAAGKLATGEVFELVDIVQMGTNTRGRVHFFVKSEVLNDPTVQVEISARPDAMKHETPRSIYNFRIDRADALPLPEDEIDEVASILGKVTNHALATSRL